MLKQKNIRLILAILVSSVLTLITGLLSNLAANTLEIDQPKNVWIALVIVFLISLPVSFYIFFYQDRSKAEPSGEISPPSVNLLPAKPYLRFFGRDTQLSEIMNAMRERKHKLIIGIDGMGGIGKTALAREVIQNCKDERIFDFCIWEPKSYESGYINETQITWSSLLVRVGRQIGIVDIDRLNDDEKENRLASLLGVKGVLIVLDNLETMAVNQDEVASRLLPLLNDSKVLMTSRRRFKGELYSVHLRGLEEESAIQMIRYEAAEKGIHPIVNASVKDLSSIVRVTGASPLALKLLIGQLQLLPLETITEAFQNINLEEDGTDEDDFVRFYKGIFLRSWQLLSGEAQQLLVSMSIFPPNIGGGIEAIQSTSGIDKKTLPKFLDELWRFSFVERGESGLKAISTKYYLHPLTRNFVRSNMVKSL